MLSRISVLVIFYAVSVFSVVYSPWIISENVPDWSGNWESFKNYHTLVGKTKQDLAIGIFDIMASKDLGILRVAGIGEPSINSSISTDRWPYKLSRDPVKTVNIFGWGYCANEGDNMSAAMHQAGVGMGIGRQWPGHGIMEVFYDGAPHYFDLDLRGYVTRPDGVVASSGEVWGHPEWVQNGDYACSIDDGIIRTWGANHPADTVYEHRLWECGHTMDFVLRMGETFTRYWRADSTRYYNDNKAYFQEWSDVGAHILSTSYTGPKEYGMLATGKPGALCNGNNYIYPGMGILKYQPNLNALYEDYEDGVYLDSNVSHVSDGIEVSNNASGFVMFDLFTPYIICGKNGTTLSDLQNKVNMTQGAVANITITGNANVKVSRNNGHTWKILGTSVTGTQAFDFTEFVYGFYQYIIKVELMNGAKLTEYNTSTIVSVAPVSLPTISGATQMQYRTGDRFGFHTKIMLFNLDLSDTTANLPATISNHNPSSLTGRATGATVLVDPPGNAKVRWLSIGGAFARSSSLQMQVSTDGVNFTPIWISGSWVGTCPSNDCHWVFEYDTSVVFTTGSAGTTRDWSRAAVINQDPPEKVWVKYMTNVQMIRIYGHYEESNRPVSSSPVKITHSTTSGIVENTFTSNTGYTVNSLSGTCLWDRMEIASALVSDIEKEATLCGIEGSIEVFPNPFNPSTVITLHFNVPVSGAELKIYNVAGNMVDNLSDKHGSTIIWNPKSLPNGVYILRATVSGKQYLKKLVFMK